MERGGLAIGAAIGYWTFDQEAFDEYRCGPVAVFGCDEPFSRRGRTLAGGAIGALLGASIGVIIGSQFKGSNSLEVTPNGTQGINVRVAFPR